MNINVSNGANVILDDNISGVSGTKLNISGTSSYDDCVFLGSANQNLNSDVITKDISLEFYNPESRFGNAIINADNTHFNFMNGAISQNNLNLNVIGNDNSISIDVDSANSKSDYFNLSGSPTSFGLNTITIRDINLISEPTQSETTFDIFDHDAYGTNLTLLQKLKDQTVYGALKKYFAAKCNNGIYIFKSNEFS